MDKILLLLLFLLQTFKYLSIIVLCSVIRYLFLNGEILFTLINSLNLIGIIFWTILFDNFYFTINYGLKNLMAKFYLHQYVFVETILALITIIFSLLGPYELSFTWRMIFNILTITLKSLVICKLL